MSENFRADANRAKIYGSMIELVNVSKHFGTASAVSELTLTVQSGELLVLLGASGSGKTTTLKMINRLIAATRGEIRIGGRDVMELAPHVLRRRIGYCFQRLGLFPHMSVAENIGITPTLLGWSRERVSHRVDELLELVELPPAEFRDRRPPGLSGGQAQRVAVARALAAEPEVVLFDEPFGALDPLTRDRLQESLLAIRARLALTMVFVTHDMLEAMLLADRIAVMHEGRLLQVGTPRQLWRTPAHPYIGQLLSTPMRQADRLHARLAEMDS